MRGWLLGRRNGQGGERQAGAKVGPRAEREQVIRGRTGSCERGEAASPGLLLSAGVGSEGRLGKVGRGPGERGGEPRKEGVLGTVEGSL